MTCTFILSIYQLGIGLRAWRKGLDRTTLTCLSYASIKVPVYFYKSTHNCSDYDLLNFDHMSHVFAHYKSNYPFTYKGYKCA